MEELKFFVDTEALAMLLFSHRKCGGHRLYNEKRKLEFIKSVPEKSRTMYVSLFNGSEVFEREYRRDLCIFSNDQMRNAASKWFRTVSSSERIMIRIKRYVRWCGEQGFPISEGLLTLKIDPVSFVGRTMFASPLHLRTILDKVFDPPSLRSIECVYRCYIWLLYAGMDLESARLVLRDEVDLTQMLVRGQYEIYREAVPDFQLARDEGSLIYVQPDGTHELRQRTGGDCLLRLFRSEALSINTFLALLKQRMEQVMPGASVVAITNSGHFYRVLELDRMGVTPNFDAVLAGSGRLDRIHSKEGLSAAFREIRQQYFAWKKAFSGSSDKQHT